MPLFLGLIGLFAPRFVIIVLWLTSNWFVGIFETRLWPILGFLLLPATLLWYSAVTNWFQGEWNWWQVLILVLAVIGDLSFERRVAK